MARHKIVWTVLPYGFETDADEHRGALRATIVVSPRLTPEAAGEQTLAAFPEFLDWPTRVAGLEFGLLFEDAGGGTHKIAAKALGTRSSARWQDLFPPTTFVEGFEFAVVARLNLRSYSVRNVMKFVRRNYGKLAATGGTQRPRLLPWRKADPALKELLSDLGTETTRVVLGDRRIELPGPPGFDRFMAFDAREGTEAQLRGMVFPERGMTPEAEVTVPGVDGKPFTSKRELRALPPDLQPKFDAGFRTPAEYDFYQANRFYTRPENRSADTPTRPDLKNVAPPPVAPELDFHGIVASFADYPPLMRELGLLIDIVLPIEPSENALMAALLASPDGRVDGAVSLLPPRGGALDVRDDAFPRTALRVTKRRFATRARTNEIADGLLALAGATDRYEHTDSPYDVYQVDPDGAALKTVDFLLTSQRLVAGSLQPRGDGRVTYSTGDRQAVGALRSGSIGVSHHGRARAVAIQAASTSMKNEALAASARRSGEVLLFAEDVLRGYRVDVQPASTGTWNSLCRRVGTYEVLDLTHAREQPVYGPDEGYVKGASTTSKEGSDDHYLHESLFRWAGWSLVAPRPGRAIVAEADGATALQRERVETVSEVAANNTGVIATFKAEPGSLPKLRFGERYRIRARLVDLAGNSLEFDDPSLREDAQATDEIAYLRFEPVDPPALVQRDALSEGEALERMVIRSNHDAGTAAYRTSAAFSAAIALPASESFAYPEVAVRHVVPPKSAQLQVEMHGLLDAAFSGAANARGPQARAAYGLVHQREQRTLFDVPGIKLVTPPAAVATATSDKLPLELPTGAKPTGDRLTGGQYVIYPDGGSSATLPTPYLPDDAACGIALRRVPGATQPMVLGEGAAIVRAPNEELVLLVVFAGEWPDRTGLRIAVCELAATIDPATCDETPTQDPTPKWNPATRELTLFVGKGRIERMQYSSFVFSRDLAQYGLRPENPIEYLETLGIPAWVTSAGARRQVEALASVGCHWMVTPDRPLVLVHATQQPVCEPQFLEVHANRVLGDTFADLGARLRMHGPSTGKFEILAEWSETVDDPLRGPPERIKGSGQLSEVALPENFRNAFGLDELIDRNLAEAVDDLPNPGGPADPKPAKARGDRHDFGDTRFRLVRYRLRATTRFREYFPRALADERANIARTGSAVDGVQVDRGAEDDFGAPVRLGAGARDGCIVVPNSAPPTAPTVVYVLPTFSWQRDLGADKPKQSSTRVGNGLRVYLDRPWFSSGDGELFGVVIRGERARFDAIPPALTPFVTQWGIDPLFDSVLPTDITRVSDFPLRVASAEVKLLESDTERVTVVGHRVQWDAQRELWYCDIELDAGRNYMPFVRLALVRFQPHSIPGAEISRVVLADFAQLMPRRSIALERAGATVKLTVRGPAPEYGPMKTSPLQTEFIENRSYTGAVLGPPRESGRNRLEVVVQTRNPDIDSDLEWTDLRVLGSTLLDPPGSGMVAEAAPAGPPPAAPGARRRGIDPREAVREAAGLRSPGLGIEHAGAHLGTIRDILQPLLWEGSVTLPELAQQKARLAIREFERFYTDESVNDAVSGRLLRVIGERLVYAEFFPLSD